MNSGHSPDKRKKSPRSAGFIEASGSAYAFLLFANLRHDAAKPMRPILKRATVFGSGTACPSPRLVEVVELVDIVFVSIVSTPFKAKTLPHTFEDLLLRVMLYLARILPSNILPVPSVAKLPT